mgnify:CR=1 FL=1
MKSFLKAFKEFSFASRVNRKDFWMFYLFNILFLVLICFIEMFIEVYLELYVTHTVQEFNWLSIAYCLIMFLPTLSMEIKRLHDIGKSGNWLLLHSLSIIGGVILIVFMCKKGDENENKYGPAPNGTKTKTNEQVKDLASQSSINENVLCSSVSEPLNFNELPEPPIETINPNSETVLPIEQKTPSRNNISKSTLLIIFAIALFLSIGANIYLFMQYKSSVEKNKKLESDYVHISKAYSNTVSSNAKLRLDIETLNRKLDFYDSCAVIIPYGTKTYHTYDCYRTNDMESFYIFNYHAAQYYGYYPCDKCNPPQ